MGNCVASTAFKKCIPRSKQIPCLGQCINRRGKEANKTAPVEKDGGYHEAVAGDKPPSAEKMVEAVSKVVGKKTEKEESRIKAKPDEESQKEKAKKSDKEKEICHEVVKKEEETIVIPQLPAEVVQPPPVIIPKKSVKMKRSASAAAQVDSVLRRRTENVRDLYSLGKKLGHGQYGTTFLCIERATGKEYACKSIPKRKLQSVEDVEDVRREIDMLHHMSGNPNVISIKDAYEDQVAVHVVMELCSGGELFDRIVQRGHYSEKDAAKLARVIVGVVEACHSLGVMHRDLKPENFLFLNEEEDSPLKTIDFGLSTYFKPGEIFHDVVGSPYYVAPEVLRKSYGPEADVWSAGVIIYILLCGVPPFWGETENEIFVEILRAEIDFNSDPWPKVSESAKDLVKKMLVRDPKKRLTAHEVLCHPWVRVDGVAPDKPLDSAVLTRFKQFSAMDKLKRLALRVISDTISEEEIAGLREIFKMIDTDNSGQITYNELKDGLRRFGARLHESELLELMKAADIDNNGIIDYGEFIAATLHLNKVMREEHLLTAFSFFDKDGSGFITSDELQQACVKFGMTDIQWEEIIKEIDQDNDGRIDYNEFVAMMQKGNMDNVKFQFNRSKREPLKVS